MQLFDLSGKKALVTGGTRGLGYGLARGLLEAGADAVIVGSSDHVHIAAQQLQADTGQHTIAIQADLSDREQVKSTFDRAMELLGTIDILVVNHGMQHRARAEEFDIDAWDAVIELNLTSMFLLNQLAGRHMLEKGYGKIINIGSMTSFIGGFQIPAYAVSKGGVARLTMSLSNEWGSRGVNINCIAPGYMATDMTQALIDDNDRNRGILERIPMGRWGSGDDLKGAVVFLASAASDYVNGIVLPVDGGWMGR